MYRGQIGRLDLGRMNQVWGQRVVLAWVCFPTVCLGWQKAGIGECLFAAAEERESLDHHHQRE